MATMGNILHDWGLEEKKILLKKAYDALPAGGALIVIENIIDNERNKNAFGLMMSLNMMIETDAGFDFSAARTRGGRSRPPQSARPRIPPVAQSVCGGEAARDR